MSKFKKGLLPPWLTRNKETRIRKEKRIMEKMLTQLELLMKHEMGAPIKAVNVVASKAYVEEEAK